MQPCSLLLALLAALIVSNQILAQETAAKLPPISVTLKADNLPIATILADLSKQSGMEVVDGRTLNTDKTMSLDLHKATFWEAVDAIAREAGAAVSLYAAKGKVVLVNRPGEAVPVSHGGVIRGTVLRLEVSKDLVSGFRQCRIGLEVNWEPRLEPLYLEVAQWSVKFGPDNDGMVLEETKKGTGRTSLFGRSAREIVLICQAPERSSESIQQLRGAFSLITPEKMWNATFDNLPKIIADRKPVSQSDDGVSVTLGKLVVEQGLWEVELVVQYPAGGPTLESFEAGNRLANNKFYLQNKTNKAVVFQPEPGEEQREELPDNKVRITYFLESKAGQPDLRDPADWQLIYRTAGRLVQVQVPFEFKELPLP
jgi:hypothetical protein